MSKPYAASQYGTSRSIDCLSSKSSNNADMLDDHDSVLLSAKESKYYYTVVARLLYLAKRTRPDILTAISILCGRVLNATEYDLQLAIKVVKYLNGTRGYGLNFDDKQSIDRD